ncbi:DUF1129 domain-containing protein [Vaginisenegalia massiliensis]|uniref:DUF1129 domain-containing protein n=1 Tax=Vaginisenegalia massiliensis TaxID=2058294 RepID=UPI000F549BC6|nr:DUF1129 family protein [Vaginisenegalia massiliensis]
MTKKEIQDTVDNQETLVDTQVEEAKTHTEELNQGVTADSTVAQADQAMNEASETIEFAPNNEETTEQADLSVPVADEGIQDSPMLEPEEDDQSLVEDTVHSEEESLQDAELNQEASQGLLAVVDADVFNRLTKRNQQFMITLDKNLAAANLASQVRRQVYTELCETLLEGQHTGQTARQLYGTPTECAQTILKQQFPTDDPQAKSPEKHLAIDGGLVLGSMYTILSGFMLMRGTTKSTAALGIITLVINYLMAGVAMLFTSRAMPDLDTPKGKKKGYLRYFAISIGTMMLWILAVSGSSMILPKSINITLPPYFYILIGSITLALHFYLKKKWNVRGGVF